MQKSNDFYEPRNDVINLCGEAIFSIFVVFSNRFSQTNLTMGKISDVQLRSKAVILAQEGHSDSVIGVKLGRSKGWVAKWIERSK